MPSKRIRVALVGKQGRLTHGTGMYAVYCTTRSRWQEVLAVRTQGQRICKCTLMLDTSLGVIPLYNRHVNLAIALV